VGYSINLLMTPIGKAPPAVQREEQRDEVRTGDVFKILSV